MPSSYDTSWCLLNANEWDYLLKDYTKTFFSNFWLKRQSGISNYSDASNAYRHSENINSSIHVPSNVIFLHIFRDSPFNCIDNTRIFADYVDWILQTLSIIQYSQEDWLIKAHPSALR